MHWQSTRGVAFFPTRSVERFGLNHALLIFVMFPVTLATRFLSACALSIAEAPSP